MSEENISKPKLNKVAARKEKLRAEKEAKINHIVHSLGKYALGDIKANIECGKPLAAMLLATCFIDQMAAYRFNYGERRNKTGYKDFIDKYLIQYKSLDLYTNLRNKIVHNYSISEHFYIPYKNYIEVDALIDINMITPIRFYNSLVQAFNNFAHDIRTDGKARNAALGRYKNAPPFSDGQILLGSYTEFEADTLINHYGVMVKGMIMNQDSSLIVGDLYKNSIYAGLFEVKATLDGYPNHTVHLNEIIRQHKLPPVETVL